MKTPKQPWKAQDLDVLKVHLDRENPRVEIPAKATQAEIRLLLLEHEDVLDLAKDIIASDGLMAGEQIIVAKEGGHNVVLEGNRRTCACQLLVRPSLIPKEFKGKFPSVGSTELKNRLKTIPAAIAPDRDAAEITITRRHTKVGIKPWLPIAQYRRIKKMIHAGRTPDQIAEIFGISKGKLMSLLKQSELMRLAHESKHLTHDEHEELRNPKLKTNAYTRFFTLKGVRQGLGIAFEKDGSVEAQDKPKFEKAVTHLVREFLLPEPGTTQPRSNTRTDPSVVFTRMAADDASLRPMNGVYRAAVSEKGKKSKPKPRATKFFENLDCQVKDDHLIKLSDEIRRISYTAYPTAAAFLARALMERTLLWCVEQKKLKGEFMKKHGAKYGFKDLIKFCTSRADDIFNEPSAARRVLKHWTDSHKTYCDLVIHGNWIMVDKNVLELLSKHSYYFIRKVLNGEML